MNDGPQGTTAFRLAAQTAVPVRYSFARRMRAFQTP
jgi:hypothetical protein